MVTSGILIVFEKLTLHISFETRVNKMVEKNFADFSIESLTFLTLFKIINCLGSKIECFQER